VSASLKRLRETFDDPLFTRTSHGVVPTPRALALAPRVDAVLQELQQLINLDRAFDPGNSDRILRIAGSDYSCHAMLPLLCRDLAARGSRIRIAWELADYSQLPERLRKGDVDLGLLPRMTPAAGVESELLYEDAYIVAARRGHPSFATGMGLDAFCTLPHVVLGRVGPCSTTPSTTPWPGRAGAATCRPRSPHSARWRNCSPAPTRSRSSRSAWRDAIPMCSPSAAAFRAAELSPLPVLGRPLQRGRGRELAQERTGSNRALRRSRRMTGPCRAAVLFHDLPLNLGNLESPRPRALSCL
jgi:hypothetical protein